MSDNNETNQQEYKGVGKLAAALGQSIVDSYKGLGIGAAIGAVTGLVSHNKEAHQLVKESTGKFGNINTLKEGWNFLGRGGKAGVAAAIAGIAVASVTQITGLFKGIKKTNEAREQFNEISGENKNLKEKLAASEASIAQIKSAVSQAEKPSEKSHVADLEAARARQSERAAAL